MNTITVKEEGYIYHQTTTWRGAVDINGEEISYEYVINDNGDSCYILTEEGYKPFDPSNNTHTLLIDTILQYGDPEAMGADNSVVDTE
tara:strand:+ start:470 stop:733 length:264 start_codon:yes stop_codon:yes gene_type:complete